LTNKKHNPIEIIPNANITLSQANKFIILPPVVIKIRQEVFRNLKRKGKVVKKI